MIRNYFYLVTLVTFAGVAPDWAAPGVGTGARPFKPTNSVTIRQSASNLCTNHLFGEFVEHPEDCRMFFLCMENGDAVLASCPSTMLFNTESRLCDAAENVRCSNATNTIPQNPSDTEQTNDQVTDAASYCANLTPLQSNDRIVYIGSSTSCGNYYICYYGQAILQECSKELHWNAITGKCDIPVRAQCTVGGEQMPPDSASNGNPSPLGDGNSANEFIHCPAYGQHLYPHMKRCEFFIYCVKGHATLQQCPFYYFFDVVTKSCQWSRTALCARNLQLPRQLKHS